MSVDKYRKTLLTISSLRSVWAPAQLPQSLESELTDLLDGLWRQMSPEEQETLERRFPAHIQAFQAIVRATIEARVAWQTANEKQDLPLDPPSGGPEHRAYPPLLLRPEGPTREAPLGGPVSEASERGTASPRPNLRSDFAPETWTMRAQRCELCETHDPKREGCEGYCPARDEPTDDGFSWDGLERLVVGIEEVLGASPLREDFTAPEAYVLAYDATELALYVRRHLLDCRPACSRTEQQLTIDSLDRRKGTGA